MIRVPFQPQRQIDAPKTCPIWKQLASPTSAADIKGGPNAPEAGALLSHGSELQACVAGDRPSLETIAELTVNAHTTDNERQG
jgi:hypothetical protein